MGLPGEATPAAARETGARRPRHLPLLALLSLWAAAPVAYLIVRSAAGHGSLTGAFGLYPTDQAQYLAWVRDAGEHGLVSNRFDLAAGDHVFLHPMFFLSGVLWRAGAAIQLSYLVWLPVAVGVLFGGFRAYARRMVGAAGWAAALVLVVALFYFGPAFPLLDAAGLDGGDKIRLELIAYEAFNAVQVWGYLPATIAVGLLPLVLLGAERLVDPERRSAGRGPRWYALWTAAGGAAIAWLHPWQGVTLIAILVPLALWGRLGRRHLALAAPVAGAALPLLYYAVLSRSDPAWELARQQTEYPRLPLLAAAVLAPLAALAAVDARGRARDAQERIVRLWPLAAVAVYLLLPTAPYHALQGVALPLAVLAVRGWRGASWSRARAGRALAGAAVAAAVVPGVVHAGYLLQKYQRGERGPYLLRSGERRALAYLDDTGRPGGVLARAEMGSAVPAFTGRSTWVGHPTWTPDEIERARAADDLFGGRLPAAGVVQLVSSSHAAFLLADCGANADLSSALGRSFAARRFGCATLYERTRP